MTYTKSQIEALANLANHFGDPWMIGMEADRIKREQNLTDKDIMVILRTIYDRPVAESTIQSNRVMYSIFGDKRVRGCRFSHHQAAAIEARVGLGLSGTHLSEDEAREVRTRSCAILEAVKAACGPEPTVDDVRCFLRGAPAQDGARRGQPRAGEGAVEPGRVQSGQRRSAVPPAGDGPVATVTSEEIEKQSTAPQEPARQDAGGGAPETKTAPKTLPARGEAKQEGGVTGQSGELKLVRQIEKQIARASGRQKKRLITAVAGVLQSELPTMDPAYTAEIVDRIRALAPNGAAAYSSAVSGAAGALT